MKEKGFTLIELLAVIVILALLVLVVFPAVNGVLKDSRDTAYTSQVRIVEKAAKEYYLDHISQLSELEKNISCLALDIDNLINEGYIASDDLENNKIMDPRTKNEPLRGYIKVYEGSNQYNYEFVEFDDSVPNLDTAKEKCQKEAETVPDPENPENPENPEETTNP